MVDKPKPTTSLAEKELVKVEEQFKEFDSNIKQMTMDRMSAAPLQEVESQTKIAQKDLDKTKDLYIKPKRSITSKEKFNERFREDYKFSTEYVNFIAENKEIIGEALEFWTKPFPGMPAEEWYIPVNKPVWAPRHVAERIKGSKYHRLTMNQTVSTASDGMGQYYGAMAVDTTVQRLDAIPVSQRKSLFMSGSF
jgi:hypothetical protein